MVSWLISGLAWAGPREELLHEADALRAEATTAPVGERELQRALALVREARALLGGASSTSCRDFVHPLYARVWGSGTATERTLALCSGDLASRGAELRYFYEHTSRTWAMPHSLDQAVALTRRVPPGHLEAVQYVYAVTSRIWSGVDRAVEMAARIPVGQLDCVKYAHDSTRRSTAEPSALQRAIALCGDKPGP